MHECKHEEKIDIMYDRIVKFDEKLDRVLSWKYTVRGGLAVIIFVLPLYIAWALR